MDSRTGIGRKENRNLHFIKNKKDREFLKDNRLCPEGIRHITKKQLASLKLGMFTVANHLHFLHLPVIKSKFYSISFQEVLHCRRNSLEDASQTTTIMVSSGPN